MNIKKQTLTSAAHSEFTLEALRQIAPSAFTEVRGKDGELTQKVNFDVLRELLGDAILNADEESFGFQWVGKQDAKRAAAEPTRQTLRPVVEDSVDWDTTENLYIEGDNLEVLKLLQRAYLGKVKMIYIDPPYNTGNDFVYEDDFAMSSEEMDEAMGNVDEEGNRLRRNFDSNPRYHSDWCSMIYSRLLVARTLLANDGVIFISIDDNEVHHLRKICDEVFGVSNFVCNFVRKTKSGSGHDSKSIAIEFDYILCYTKSMGACNINKETVDTEIDPKYNLTDEYVGRRGKYYLRDLDYKGSYSESLDYPITTPDGAIIYPGDRFGKPNTWRWKKAKFEWGLKNGFIVFKRTSEKWKVYIKQYQFVDNTDTLYTREVPYRALIEYGNGLGSAECSFLLGSNIFSYPKPSELVKHLLKIGSSIDSLILDFFSGSATTAHAVMQLNAEDGGKRKYICVQIPEETPEGSEARKAGYDTICEIGKERIRRAGKAVLDGLNKEELKVDFKFAKFAVGKDVDKDSSLWEYIEDEVTRNEAKQELEDIKKRRDALDTGFRVLRIDSSNMEDVYFEPAALQQDNLFSQVDNVKPDRSELDLLFGCMVDWGVELSYPLRQEEIAGKHLHIVNEGALVACFDKEINLEAIRYVAELKPLRIIFRESCFATDADKLNIYEQFKQLCGWSDDDVYSRIHVL